MLRSWTASISALFVASALIGCSSDSSDAPAQQTPAEDAATEQAEEASAEAQAEAEPDTATNEDAEPDSADAPDAKLRKCTNELDVSKQDLPCDCYGVTIESAEQAYPGCEGVVKCCPLGGGEIKCE